MTPEQKMQVIIEAAGECWHEWYRVIGGYCCNKCREHIGQIHSYLPAPTNPASTDLNELFRLAENMGCGYIEFEWELEEWYCSYTNEKSQYNCFGFAPAEALLNALYVAIKER